MAVRVTGRWRWGFVSAVVVSMRMIMSVIVMSMIMTMVVCMSVCMAMIMTGMSVSKSKKANQVDY